MQYTRIHGRAFIQNVVRSRKIPCLSALTLDVVADGESEGGREECEVDVASKMT
jgi:hypothetical protein